MLLTGFTLIMSGVGISMVSPVESYAIRPTQSGDYEDWNVKDPASWSQNPDGNPKHLPPLNKKGKSGYMYDGSGRFPYDACMIYSLTFVFLKAGVEDIGVTPADVHDRIFDSMRSYGWTNYHLLTDSDTKGVLKVGDSSEIGQGVISTAKIKDLWNDGNLIILYEDLGGGAYHAIAVDKVEGDTIYILDSGNWGTKLSDKYANKAIGYQCFKMKDNTKASDLPVLQEHPDGNLGGRKHTDDSSSLSNAQRNYTGGGGAWLPDEDAIPNMPSYREYLEKKNSGKVKGEENYHDFVESLSDKDKVDEDFKKGSDEAESVQKWKAERSSSIGDKTVNFFRLLIAVLVFVNFFVFALFVPLLFALDMWVIGGVSLISFLTFGKIRSMSTLEYDTLKGRKLGFKPLTVRHISIYTGVSVIVLVLYVTGGLYVAFDVIVNIIHSIVSLVRFGE